MHRLSSHPNTMAQSKTKSAAKSNSRKWALSDSAQKSKGKKKRQSAPSPARQETEQPPDVSDKQTDDDVEVSDVKKEEEDAKGELSESWASVTADQY